MKWHLDDAPVFLAIVEQGGISAAARVLGAPKSTVSTTLARLEAGLGLRLLDRSSRSLRLTAEGEAFLQQAQLLVEQAREADALMAGLGSAPAGRLTVALPPALTQDLVAPRLHEFRAQYPQVQLEIVVTSQGAAMVRDRVDLAVVVGSLEDSDLVSRTLLDPELIWVACPKWWRAQGRSCAGDDPLHQLEVLRLQVQVCETRYAQRRLAVQVHGRDATLDLSKNLIKVNDPLVVRRMVLGGAGVSLIPRQYCAEWLQRGELEQVWHHVRFAQAGSRLTAVYASRRLQAPRVRVFLEFMVEVLNSVNPC